MKKQISVPVASIYRQPTFQSDMVTQAVMWEDVEILEDENKWYRVRQQDGYSGWLHRFYTVNLSEPPATGKMIVDRFCPVTMNPDTDSLILNNLVFGTMLPENAVGNRQRDFLQVILPDGNRGWISETSLRLPEKSREQIAALAVALLGTPYLWGGKTSFGFDCSGFAQSVFRCVSVSLPRDSHQQAELVRKQMVDIACAQKGDLLFFAENEIVSHVGIFLGKHQFIHCSGQVKINSVKPGERDYDRELMDKFKFAGSIRDLLKQNAE